jgi:large subunit ribosomal protein L29
MARDSMKPIRERTDAEISEEVKALREQLFKLRWQASGGSVENPNKIREVRRTIARHLTVLVERGKRPVAGGGHP